MIKFQKDFLTMPSLQRYVIISNFELPQVERTKGFGEIWFSESVSSLDSDSNFQNASRFDIFHHIR